MLPKYWILQTKLHKSLVLTYTLKICTKVHNKGDLPLGRLCYFILFETKQVRLFNFFCFAIFI